MYEYYLTEPKYTLCIYSVALL